MLKYELAMLEPTEDNYNFLATVFYIGTNSLHSKL